MKIAIMGSHPITKRMAPFDDPDWKIWACSPHNFEHGQLPRVDEWFEVHQPAFCRETRTKPYQDFVRSITGKIPVWVRDKKEHPDANEYPEKELKERFGESKFSSSIAYIMAKAIAEIVDAREPLEEGFHYDEPYDDEIGLWGIMQASKNEFTYQRPGIQGLMEEAHKSGINVTVPEVSNLFAPVDDIW